MFILLLLYRQLIYIFIFFKYTNYVQPFTNTSWTGLTTLLPGTEARANVPSPQQASSSSSGSSSVLVVVVVKVFLSRYENEDEEEESYEDKASDTGT